MSGRSRRTRQAKESGAPAQERVTVTRPGAPSLTAQARSTIDKIHARVGVAGDTKADRADLRAGAGSVSTIKLILRLLLPAVVIACSYGVYSYLKASAPEVRKRAKVERAFNVSVVTARPGNYTPMLDLIGTATAGRRVDIRALVAGQVIETGNGLREGGEVAIGANLLTIDPFDYESARLEADARLTEARGKLTEQQASVTADKASLKYARQQLGLAKKDLERAVPLSRRGTVSSRTVDDRRNIVIQRQQALEQLQNSIKVWDARIAQQRAAIDRLTSVLDRAGRRLKETRLNAPFNAYVTDVSAQVGRMLSANDKVATLIDRDWIEVRLTLTDSQFGRIMAAEKSIRGRKVEVLWKIGREPLRYSATIDRVGAEITSGSGGVTVYARIDDPLTPVPLRPGAFVEVRVPDKRFTNVFRLPPAALYGGNTVYAVVNGRLASRKVRLVGNAGDDVLLTGAIGPGESIIVTRLSTPGDGVLVRER